MFDVDPVVQGAMIAAISALGAGAIATGSNIYLESRRQTAQERQDEDARAHEQRQQRYDERKAAYEDFYTALSDAEQDTLNLEAKHGLLPGDMDYELGYKSVDKSLARLQFMASDDCLAAAEKCSGAFFAWGWGGASHTMLYDAMNEFVTSVRADLDVNALSYKRPLPTARRRKATVEDAPPEA